MSPLQSRVYECILKLHPAEFRNRFAREMALDFEDALHTSAAAPLWRDLLCSLVGQWAQRISPGAPIPAASPTASLLAGDYIMMRDPSLTLLELARGAAAATALLALCALGLGGARTSIADPGIVYASSATPSQWTATGTAAADTQPTPELLLFHPPGPLPSYEVATIKLVDPDAANAMVKLPPGETLSPLSLRRYIMNAYAAIYPAQVIDGPDWLNKDAYLIHGKVPDDIQAALQKLSSQDSLSENREMAQSLLASRFHLQAHFETRILPVYALVPAKSGLKFTAVPAPPDHKPGDPPAPVQPGNPLPPGTSRATFSSNGLRVLNAHAIQIQLLARMLATERGDRPIVNHTGFTGYFDIHDLTWAPLPDANADAPMDAPSLIGALEKNLGLNLVSTKAPIQVLVIDHIDRPSPN